MKKPKTLNQLIKHQQKFLIKQVEREINFLLYFVKFDTQALLSSNYQFKDLWVKVVAETIIFDGLTCQATISQNQFKFFSTSQTPYYLIFETENSIQQIETKIIVEIYNTLELLCMEQFIDIKNTALLLDYISSVFESVKTTPHFVFKNKDFISWIKKSFLL